MKTVPSIVAGVLLATLCACVLRVASPLRCTYAQHPVACTEHPDCMWNSQAMQCLPIFGHSHVHGADGVVCTGTLEDDVTLVSSLEDEVRDSDASGWLSMPVAAVSDGGALTTIRSACESFGKCEMHRGLRRCVPDREWSCPAAATPNDCFARAGCTWLRLQSACVAHGRMERGTVCHLFSEDAEMCEQGEQAAECAWDAAASACRVRSKQDFVSPTWWEYCRTTPDEDRCSGRLPMASVLCYKQNTRSHCNALPVCQWDAGETMCVDISSKSSGYLTTGSVARRPGALILGGSLLVLGIAACIALKET